MSATFNKKHMSTIKILMLHWMHQTVPKTTERKTKKKLSSTDAKLKTFLFFNDEN